MSKQYNKAEKRTRRERYLKRKRLAAATQSKTKAKEKAAA
jgi:hypothetical protein